MKLDPKKVEEALRSGRLNRFVDMRVDILNALGKFVSCRRGREVEVGHRNTFQT